MDLVLLKSYYNKHDAEIAVGLLKEAGIESILQADDAGGFHAHLSIAAGNNRVMIRKKDAERALEVIKPLEESLTESDDLDLEELAMNAPVEPSVEIRKKSGKDKSNPAIFISLGVMVLFIVVYAIREGSPRLPEKSQDWRMGVKCQRMSSNREVCSARYMNGQVRWRGEFKNGKADGMFLEYFHDGSLSKKGNFINNQAEAKHLTYYENGKLVEECHYKNGKVDGKCIGYYPDGGIWTENSMRKGQMDGLSKIYYPDGTLWELIQYKQDVRLGDDGMSFSGEDLNFYKDGKPGFSGIYKDGRLDGRVEWYFPNGHNASVAEYKRGKLDGEVKTYFLTGELMSVDVYDNDEWVSMTYRDKEGVVQFEDWAQQ